MRRFSYSPTIGVLIGFLIYELSWMFYAGFFIYLLKVVGCIVIAYFYFIAHRNSVSTLGNAYNWLLIWIFFILVRGDLIGFPDYSQDGVPTHGLYNIIRNLFLNQHSAFSLMLPIMALLPISDDFFSSIRKLGWTVLIVWVVTLAMNYKMIGYDNLGISNVVVNGEEMSTRDLVDSLFIGQGIIVLLLFCIGYLNSNLKWLMPIAYFILFILTGSGGGRGGTLMILGTLLSAVYVWYKWPIGTANKSSFKTVIGVVVIVAVVVGAYYLILKSDVFSYFRLRFFEDDNYTTMRESSREDYTMAFIRDFNDHPLAWIFGRGLNGWYELPSGKYRCVNEWGYIHLILKGGIIYLFLYCYVLLKAAWLGIKDSCNTLSKAMAFMCIWQVLSLIPFGMPAMEVQQFLVWFFVAILMSQEYRYMSDREVKEWFHY